jgi:tRNA-modifying protein YgfZ
LNCYYTSLETEALLHIAGPDTLKFLQGQTTCDTRRMDAHLAIPGLFCTPKGRVLCDFLLFEVAPEHYALRMRRNIRADSAAAFGKYIIFSKAEIDAENEDWIGISVWGSQASATLAKVFPDIPAERFAASRSDDFVLVQMDDSGQQFECFLSQAGSAERLARMAELMTEASEADWQAQQIGSGIARIDASTVGEFVPQVLNYDLTGHISFKKGCYTGQEVVARLHYLGKSKRRAYAAELPEQVDCAIGTALFDAGSAQNVGSVVNSCNTAGKTRVLVSAVTESATNGLRLGAEDGPALALLELPYSLETD